MQYLLTQEELDAMKVKRGISYEQFQAANKGLREDLLKIAQVVDANGSPYAESGRFEMATVKDMRRALDKFQAALDEPVKK